MEQNEDVLTAFWWKHLMERDDLKTKAQLVGNITRKDSSMSVVLPGRQVHSCLRFKGW